MVAQSDILNDDMRILIIECVYPCTQGCGMRQYLRKRLLVGAHEHACDLSSIYGIRYKDVPAEDQEEGRSRLDR